MLLEKYVPRERLKLYVRVFFLVHLVLFGYFFMLYGIYHTFSALLSRPAMTDFAGKPAGHDFITFYAASALALKSEALGVYSIPRLHAMECAVIGQTIGVWPWFYPPTFLLVIWPLAIMPYGVSWTLWSGLTLFGNMKAVRQIAPHRLAPWLVPGFPGVIDNFYYGQNASLTAALLGGGLLLVDRRPWLGGALLGLITYKPQLAVLLPVALAAGRRWRALGGFVLSGAGFALLSILAFGWESWSAFLANLKPAGEILDKPSHWSKMVTVFGAARFLGAGTKLAGILQGAAALAALVLVAESWRRDWPMARKGPLLLVCTFLATPYALEYDLALLTLAFAWLGWECWHRQRWNDEIWLISLWIILCYESLVIKEIHLPLPLYVVFWLGILWVILRPQPGSAPGAALKERVET